MTTTLPMEVITEEIIPHLDSVTYNASKLVCKAFYKKIRMDRERNPKSVKLKMAFGADPSNIIHPTENLRMYLAACKCPWTILQDWIEKFHRGLGFRRMLCGTLGLGMSRTSRIYENNIKSFFKANRRIRRHPSKTSGFSWRPKNDYNLDNAIFANQIIKVNLGRCYRILQGR